MKKWTNLRSGNDLVAFWQEYRNETEKGRVILGVAFLEELTEELLMKCLITDNKTQCQLERLHLRNKIQMCFFAGLISKKEKEDLLTIANIRNLYAHRTDLDSKELKNNLDSLSSLKVLKQKKPFLFKQELNEVDVAIYFAYVRLFSRIAKGHAYEMPKDTY